MSQEEKILEALANLTATMEKGFSEMNGRFESIESRLDQQEKKSRRTYRCQQLQAAEIERLKEIVHGLAHDAPVRVWEDSAAIRKSDAYPMFEEEGISSRKAMRALRNAGAIKLAAHGRSNTPTVWLDGKSQRVIVVQIGGEP